MKLGQAAAPAQDEVVDEGDQRSGQLLGVAVRGAESPMTFLLLVLPRYRVLTQGKVLRHIVSRDVKRGGYSFEIKQDAELALETDEQLRGLVSDERIRLFLVVDGNLFW